jgi:hypothetical protein
MEILSKILEKSAANAEIILISAILLAFSWHFLLSRRKYLAALVMLISGLVALGYLGGILAWASGLGGDSFLEANTFDLKEALFWVSTFFSTLSQMLAPINKTALLLLVEATVLSCFFYLILRWRPVVLRGLIFVLAANALYLVYLGYAGFESGRAYIDSVRRQFEKNPSGFKTTEDIDLFVYIGESTSTLNMSLYGYPLSTTPRLDALHRNNAGFLRFDRIRSTHTHTSPSLLRAFAITSPQEDGRLVRWGIGSVLGQSGLKSHLDSVQPLNGSWASFSRFVFDGLTSDLPPEDQYKGNYAIPKIKDHQLLERSLNRSGVVFFQSYAGHGPYLDHIDTTMSLPVQKPATSFDGAYGSILSEWLSDPQKEAAEYDQAITYIDRNVAHAIENIQARSKPAALIFFSDHGDAVFARRGHESSNFIDEMSTVPMVLYFNEAYRKKYPETFGQYQKAALQNKTKLLDQISPTILDILHIHSTAPLDVPTLASSSKHPRPYIIERDTVSGPSRIDLEYNVETGFSKTLFFGGTSDPTYISVINETFGEENTICYHRSDSFAKALRAAAVANCLEFDLVVDGDALNVYHPPAAATGFSIEHVFRIAQARKNKLWIDAKNLSDPSSCDKLASYLEVNHVRVGQLLVEFPWDSSRRLIDLQSCGKRLRSISARTSYYVPTHILVPCAESPIANAEACKELDDHVQHAMASGIFSDLSFDFLGYPAMKRIPGADHFKWNTWAIKAKDFHRFPRKSFGFVIMDTTTDPNTY